MLSGGVGLLHAALLIAVVVIWVMSCQQPRYVKLQCANVIVHVFANDGQCLAHTGGYGLWAFRTYWWRSPFEYDGRPMIPIEERTFGFETVPGGDSEAADDGAQSAIPDFAITFPLWAAAIACLPGWLLPTLSWLRGRGRRRAGLCDACGYDLCASPARCPECGAEPLRRINA